MVAENHSRNYVEVARIVSQDPPSGKILHSAQTDERDIEKFVLGIITKDNNLGRYVSTRVTLSFIEHREIVYSTERAEYLKGNLGIHTTKRDKSSQFVTESLAKVILEDLQPYLLERELGRG